MINFKLNINSALLEKKIKESINKNARSKVIQRAKESIRDAIRYKANTILREQISRFAPDHFMEKKYLNEGIDNKSRKVGMIEGGDSSRFMKAPEFMYVKEAILKYAKFSISTISSGDLYDIKFQLTGDSEKKIVDSIGFAWMKKIGGRGSKALERRSTLDGKAYQPMWRSEATEHILYKWEYGGTYTVTPRDKSASARLHPGPDRRIASQSVDKTIPATRMFYRGLRAGKYRLMKEITSTLQKRFKK